MSLQLGSELNRCYSLRKSFLNYYYDIHIFYNTHTNYLLFKVDPPIINHKMIDNDLHGIKINMFKNLKKSEFCSNFLNLHNYKNDNLNILCQYDSIKDFYFSEISLTSSENIILNKIKSDDKIFNDSLTLYNFILKSKWDEFIFIIAERQIIVKNLKRKIVRSTGLQIASTDSINYLNELSEWGNK